MIVQSDFLFLDGGDEKWLKKANNWLILECGFDIIFMIFDADKANIYYEDDIKTDII